MAPGSGAGVNEESIKAKRAEVEKQKQAAADNLRKQLFGLKPDLNVMRSAVAESRVTLRKSRASRTMVFHPVSCVENERRV